MINAEMPKPITYSSLDIIKILEIRSGPNVTTIFNTGTNDSHNRARRIQTKKNYPTRYSETNFLAADLMIHLT